MKLTDFKDIKIGDTNIEKVLIGSDVVWERGGVALEIPEYYVLLDDSHFIDRSTSTVNYFEYTGDHEYVIVPEKIFGKTVTNLQRSSYYGMFSNKPIKGVAVEAPENVTGMRRTMQNNPNLTLEVDYLDTSYATDLQRFFYDTQATEITGLGNWNTENVASMRYMFGNACISNESLSGLSNWDTSNVTDMSYMFGNACISNESLSGLSNWDTSNVTDMSYMFYDVELWTIFDASPSTQYTAAFNRSVGTLDYVSLVNWDLSNVTNMNHMFNRSKRAIVYMGNHMNKIPLYPWVPIIPAITVHLNETAFAGNPTMTEFTSPLSNGTGGTTDNYGFYKNIYNNSTAELVIYVKNQNQKTYVDTADTGVNSNVIVDD